MTRANSKLARNLFSLLPALIEARVGPYRLPREGDAGGD
jgi:hypothetical protein